MTARPIDVIHRTACRVGLLIALALAAHLLAEARRLEALVAAMDQPLRQAATPPGVRPEPAAAGPAAPARRPDYGRLIAESQAGQIAAMKTRLAARPDRRGQEDGVTVESLDAMARERRMAW
jgi:hypothetical protein